jgi:hypothetical protein
MENAEGSLAERQTAPPKVWEIECPENFHEVGEIFDRPYNGFTVLLRAEQYIPNCDPAVEGPGVWRCSVLTEIVTEAFE